jgi:hypothetical protein
MDETQDTGVTTQAEGETAATTPGSEQTPQISEGAESTTKPEVNEDDHPVPYSRFKEVNDKMKTYETRFKEYEDRLTQMGQTNKPVTPEDQQAEAVKQTLKNYGFLSKDEFDKALNEREQRLREDAQVQQELSRLETRYDGKNGLPKFDRRKVVEFAIDRRIADPEVAYKTLYEKEYLNWHIQNAANKSQGVKTETSDGSGGKPGGASTKDLYEAATKGDNTAFDTLIKRSNVFQSFFKK